MGYPVLSGEEMDYVIYQGNIVRSYTVPKDPRSNAQLSSRRYLSDLVKMRGQLGLFAKAACKSVFGTKWATIVYQIARADINSWWSSAVSEWNGFDDVSKEAWRQAAPYQACFNDVGLIFFGLTRVVYHALLGYSSFSWDSLEWGPSESALARAWWNLDMTNVLNALKIDNAVGGLAYVGSWQRVNAVGAYLGNFEMSASTGEASLGIYVLGSVVDLFFTASPSAGSHHLYREAEPIPAFSQYAASVTYQQSVNVYTGIKRMVYVKIERWYGVLTFDYLSVR
jgi:hypothetical protein